MSEKEKNYEEKLKEDEEWLAKWEASDNDEGVNYDLPPNSDVCQIAKYKICKQMLIYQQDNDLTDEEVAKKISLSVSEARDILFCNIKKLTLDKLVIYASKLFEKTEVNITFEQKTSSHVRNV